MNVLVEHYNDSFNALSLYMADLNRSLSTFLGDISYFINYCYRMTTSLNITGLMTIGIS